MRKWIEDIREKTRDMDREHTLEYIRNYYWYHILIGFIILGLVVLLIYHIGWGERKKEFSCVLVNQAVDYGRDEKIAEGFGSFAGIDPRKILIDSDYHISYPGKKLEDVKESSYEKFFFNWSVEEIDAMVMEESFYEYCLGQEGEFTGEKVPVKGTLLESLLEEEEDDPLVLVFPANAPHKDIAAVFQEYVKGREKW
ncbi:MAG: hypothetical protein HFG41_13705 [Coprococcus sp.]|nr:hypothetical protein [Coprococcus sp.]